MTCKEPGCTRLRRARGWCNTHYERWRKHGTTHQEKRLTPSSELWAFVEKAILYEGGECLLWPFPVNGRGYPAIWNDGKSRRVHNLICGRVHGPAPSDKKDAAHSCGVRRCLTPRHLSWKTRKENLADCVIHGTSNRGSNHPGAKLNECDIGNIRQLFASGLGAVPIATFFDVTRHQIGRIVRRQAWGHIR